MKRKQGFYEKYIKRPLDFILSLIAIILLSPVFLIVTILVRINLGGPVIFKEERLGLNETKFILYKFRSMKDSKDIHGNFLSDDDRITNFGKKIRNLSIDELPELFNILKGDMSLVGPRPLPSRYKDYFTSEEHHRHDVRPGLTGRAQVKRRNMMKWEEKFQEDLIYIKKITFFEDMKLIFKTIKKVFKCEDVISGDKIEFVDYIILPLDKEREKNV